MVSIAIGVLCAVCSVTGYLMAAKLKYHIPGLSAGLFVDGKRANSYALTTDELSDHHYV